MDTQPRIIRLHTNDNVVVARSEFDAGKTFESELVTNEAIPAGHKIAAAKIDKNQPVRKYDQIIGFASCDIAPGEHVHEHNMTYADFERDYQFGVGRNDATIVPDAEQAVIPPNAALAPGSIGKKTPSSLKKSFNCSLVTQA